MSTLFKDSIVYAEYGETIAVGDMLYMSQGTGADSARTAGQLYKLEIANPDRNVFYGIAKEAGIADDTNKKVVTGGKFDGLSSLTPGLPVYADPAVAGGVTQVRPASNVQVIGVAIDADSFSVNGALAGSFGAGEGSGGVGGVDILFVQDFEAAALGDFVQTGLVLSSVDPLKGAISANLVHQAAINQSFKQTIAVDEKFRNRNITLKLNIKSEASEGNVTLTVVDETNSVTLVSSEQLPVSNDVGGATGIVTFNVPSSCTSLSYEIVALPEAGSPVTIIDDIIAELSVVSLLETSVEVPVQTPWQSYVPTFQGFGTPTNIEMQWRQVGENVEIRGRFTSGISTAVEARVGLPSGFTSGNTSTIPSLQIAGSAGSNLNDVMRVYHSLIQPNVTYINFGQVLSTQGSNITVRNGDNLVGNGQVLAVQASVPCAGLSATKATSIPLAQSVLVQEADSMVRVDTANGYGSTGIRRFSNLQTSIGSSITFISDAVNGDRFVVNESGMYDISYTDNFNASGNMGISKNAPLATDLNSLTPQQRLAMTTTAGVNLSGTTAIEVYLEKDDIIRAHTNGTASGIAARAQFTITKQGSLKQVNPNPNSKITIPTSELRMEGASTRGSTATAIVRFDNIAKIRGDAFEVLSDAALGTRIVMKKKGKLDIQAHTNRASTGTDSNLTINQQTLTGVGVVGEILAGSRGSTGAGVNVTLSWSGDVNVGDVLRLASGINPADVGNNNRLNLYFQEQDISVSVTNTLPQFSESDSSVRVDTANGYGSTGTRIRRFSNVRDNIGNDIEYVPSAVNGDSFVVKSAGVYHVSYSDSVNGANGHIGITLNSNNLATNLSVLLGNPNNEVLAAQDRANTASANFTVNASWQGFLNSGDVIRAHTDGLAPVNNNSVKFTISKVGKPNVTGVDVTPFVNIPQPTITERVSAGTIQIGATTTAPTKGNATVDRVSYERVGDSIIVTMEYTQTTAGAVGSGDYLFKIPAGHKIDLSKITPYTANIGTATQRPSNIVGNFIASGNAAIIGGVSVYDETSVRLIGGVFSFGAGNTLLQVVGSSAGTNATLNQASLSYGITFKVPIVGFTATNPNLLTAPESFSTDTASLTYAPSSLYTLADLDTAPVGTFITFQYAAGGNVRTQTTTAPTQTVSDMNVNGIRIFTRAYNAASNADNPAAFAIQIGKGLKGRSLDFYKSVGKVIGGSLDVDYIGGSAETRVGINLITYREAEGILIVDAGYSRGLSNITHDFVFDDLTLQKNGYLVINASKSPALTGVPLVQPRIATIKDVKPNNTAGGTFTSGSYQTRTLNTLDDPTGIVKSLASNQFTLGKGTYYIESEQKAFGVGLNKSKLRNITDSTDELIGFTFETTSGGVGTHTPLKGTVVVPSDKVFEIQHRCNTTNATNGFGSAANFGEEEVYLQLKITKIK